MTKHQNFLSRVALRNKIKILTYKQTTLFTLTIGDPIFPDKSLPRKECELDLIRRAHEAVCRLSGNGTEDNLYPPIFNGSKRIDYYPAPFNKEESLV